MLKTALEKIAIMGRKYNKYPQLSELQADKLNHLNKYGYVIFDHYVGSEKFEIIKEDYIRRMQTELEFTTPCLAQTKINVEKHKELLDNNFYATTKELNEQDLTFYRDQVKSYEQVLNEFAPSTLTLEIPDQKQYFDLWLDSDLIQVTSAYMGFTPILIEAYVRRNFPARHQVMNHYWHRDTNHPTHLLKAFIFFSDCTLKTGPHHYISGSINDKLLIGRKYYSDEEVANTYPAPNEQEIVSVVPAGTIILEDTRGLHKAGVPEEGYRDLGYSVFLPPVAFKKHKPLYKISKDVHSLLDVEQKKFISSENIIH